MRLVLVNPNTSAATTAAMLAVAREAAPAGVAIRGETVASGAPLITNEAALATAAGAVLDLLRSLPDRPDGIIVSAFGDPGLAEARRLVRCPVTGIAEAAMAAAGAGGRSFAVATTTAELAGAIARIAEGYGHGRAFRGVFLTPGDPAALMADPAALAASLLEACEAASRAGADAVVIGGGPLAAAAKAIASLSPLDLVQPVPAAVRLAVRRADAVG